MLRKFFTSPLLRNLLFVLLLLGIASGLGYLATRYHVQRDITHNASNSLEPASVEVLRQLSGPVNITVYATEQDARLGDIRKIIRNFMSLYQRYKPDIQLAFIDPEKEPGEAIHRALSLGGRAAMMRIWDAVGAVVLLAAMPGPAQASAGCAVERPADGNLKTYSARYFAAANDAAIDALIACLGSPDPAVRDDFALTLWVQGLRG